MTRIFYLFIIVLCVPTQGVYAAEVKPNDENLILNANLEKRQDWPEGPTVLITHGTLSHNKS